MAQEESILEIRNASFKDVDGIVALVSKVYKHLGGYKKEMIKGHISHFREGVFVVEVNNKIVAYSASILVDEATALKPHTWSQITANGYGATHNIKGKILYGFETCVDPEMRGQRIGQRIYNARQQLVQFKKLKGIVFGGRIPNYHNYSQKFQLLSAK